MQSDRPDPRLKQAVPWDECVLISSQTDACFWRIVEAERQGLVKLWRFFKIPRMHSTRILP